MAGVVTAGAMPVAVTPIPAGLPLIVQFGESGLPIQVR